MGKTSLENAIRDEAEQAIRAIALKEAKEIKRLDDTYAAEIDDFKKRIREQMDAKISQESYRLKNRTSLDLKKSKLKIIEKFMSRILEETMQTVRDNPKYKRFLLDAIAHAAGQIQSGAELRLRREDLVFEEEIRKAVKKVRGDGDIVIMEDNTIKWGGCIIVDVSGGRIFDSTIERTWFRKSALIRREVMGLLGIAPMDKAKECSCKIS